MVKPGIITKVEKPIEWVNNNQYLPAADDCETVTFGQGCREIRQKSWEFALPLNKSNH